MSVVVAPATPLARSALGVVRLTGTGALDIATAVCRLHHAAPVLPRRVRRVSFQDADGVFDDGMLLYFRGPDSVTGEDVVELTCHGNPVVMQTLIAACIARGARMAEAGEFTRRAVVNGKMDLVAAEGVHTAIEASGRAGLSIARAALEGAHSKHYDGLRTGLCIAGAELEARLDQPGDALATEDDDAVIQRIVAVVDEAVRLGRTTDRARQLVDGARVALVGETNAGKSSLFNQLVGRRRALVHDQAGTTRDVLEVRTRVGDVPITLLDTAGERVTTDPVEAAGLALAQELVDDADLLVVVVRATPDAPSEVERTILERTADRARVVVYNGVDVPDVAPTPPGMIATSASTGEGIAALVDRLAQMLATSESASGDVLIASERQAARLRRVAELGREAIEALHIAGPAVSADLLTEAVSEIDALTGADPREGVLDALFSRFCIGK